MRSRCSPHELSATPRQWGVPRTPAPYPERMGHGSPWFHVKPRGTSFLSRNSRTRKNVPVDETGTLESVIGFPTPYAAFCRVPATTMREHLNRRMDVPADVLSRSLQGSLQISLVRLRPPPHQIC